MTPVATARAERLVNLVLCLLSTRQYLTAERIRDTVPGYAEAPTDEAFFRTFERDKAELRDLGIPLETGRNSAFDHVDGYRIARRDYELGDIELEPDEAAAVGLAVRLWDSPVYVGAARGALLKLRAAGVEVDERAPTGVEPKVRATDHGFAPLVSAVQSGHAVRFGYRRAGTAQAQQREIEPWGVVSWRGRWYVVGYDRHRSARRCFRLSRIVGEVRTTGPAGAVAAPPEQDLLGIVAGEHSEPPATRALVWVAPERAQGLRRAGKAVERRELGGTVGDVLELELRYPESAAGWIAGYGPDAVVLEPDTLRKSVYENYLGVLAPEREARL